MKQKVVFPLEDWQTELLATCNEAATVLHTPYVIAGAFARDLYFQNIHGRTVGRLTEDIDLALAVEGWDQFELFKRQLLNTHHFSAEGMPSHRLLLRGKFQVDIVPFGAVEDAAGLIHWPPRGDKAMNCTGLAETMQNALHIEIAPDLTVPVAAPFALTFLKLSAWLDRGVETKRDALDFHYMLKNYGNTRIDWIYSTEALDILDAVDSDLDLAGAALLGREAARIMRPRTRENITSLFSNPRLVDALIDAMTPIHDDPKETESIARLTHAYREGIEAGAQ